MIPVTRKDILVIRMGLDSLLESIHQIDMWSKAYGEHAVTARSQRLVNAILATRRKFVGEEEIDVQITKALSVAEGLRDAARHCSEGQAALHTRLVLGAEAIEWLCRSR